MEKRKVQFSPVLTGRQCIAYDALLDPKIKRVLYGGAKGGGKSWFLCVKSFLYAWDICVRFGLRESNNPIHIGWLGRKQATDFTSTTLQTWRQTIPEEYYELRSGTEKDSKHILIMGRIAIDYGGLDRQESINKFNSAEYAFIGIDQAEETERDDISVLRGSLRLTIKGERLHYWELYTANPRACWLRDDFITDPRKGNIFVPALPSDNPHLPEGYEETLMDAFGHRPELIQAYLHGDWSQIEDSSQIIKDKWVQAAMSCSSLFKGKVLSCDPARFGDDKAKIMLLEGSEIEYEETRGQSRTTELSARLADLSRANGDCPIVVDSIGIGAGVVDELHEWGRNVIAFNGAAKASREEKYYNLRAEGYWELSQHFAKREIGCLRMTSELRKQLTSIRYEIRNGRILIESKEKVKERLGHSPDASDCYMMGVWAVKKVVPTMSYPVYRKDRIESHSLLKGLPLAEKYKRRGKVLV